MKFVPIALAFDPERGTGKITALEAVEVDGSLQAVGDTQFTIPISGSAADQISEILVREVAAAPAKMAAE